MAKQELQREVDQLEGRLTKAGQLQADADAQHTQLLAEAAEREECHEVLLAELEQLKERLAVGEVAYKQAQEDAAAQADQVLRLTQEVDLAVMEADGRANQSLQMQQVGVMQ